MSLLSEWKKAKNDFEKKTGVKKPSSTLLGVFKKSSELEKSIKNIEKADTFDTMEIAQKSFQKAQANFNSLCNKQLAKEKKTAEYKAELGQLMTALNNIAETALALEPMGAVDQEIFNEDISNQVLAKAKTKNPITLKNVKIKASIKMDKRILKEFEDNPRLRQQFIDTPAGLRGPTIAVLAAKLDEYNNAAQLAVQAQDAAGVKQAESNFEKFVVAELDKLTKETEKAVLSAWNNFVKVKTAYKNYKIKVSCNMAVGALVLTGSILLVASGPATGGGFIFGMFGICKQSIALVGDVATYFISAETWQKKMHANFAQYLTITKGAKSGTAFELVGKVLSSQTGNLIGSWTVPTLSAIKKDNATFGSKLDGVEVKVNNYARHVESNLKNQDKLLKERDEVANWVAAAEMFSDAPDAKAHLKKNRSLLNELSKSLAKYEEGMQTLLLAIDKMNDSLKIGRNAHAAFTMAIKELEARNISTPKLIKWLDAGIAIVDMSVGAGIAGGGGGFESWEKAARPILATVLKAEKAAWVELLKRT